MYLQTCGGLLLSGLILNVTDRRMFALTTIVGISIFIPVPSMTSEQFYSFCIGSEILIAILSCLTGKDAGFLVANACVLLVIAHVMGYALDGSAPLSPYHIIVKLLELSELGICVALSPVIAPILRNQDAT